ncbi:AEL010Wp [Eremothecium gossypii ATCC 10895]|uniref:AEL010Wp n=1 Tax=Eremothecium gossypii (strain ATCC 10895 / CBS 109.51 / FGSC 9923 / NRRL Y-1056) TaxID=284811 RepID=Q757M1_EREGS|nr:AEL010Wp [Eremothecium gossypii ATCC 10895]AAS52675.2 AEL010Wp [Eremothecium gossypii ATCC 10895]AEY96980.1 FAEL010Wp [Eremothecium gossypii FDAG1]
MGYNETEPAIDGDNNEQRINEDMSTLEHTSNNNGNGLEPVEAGPDSGIPAVEGGGSVSGQSPQHEPPAYELSYVVGVAENKNAKFRRTMEDVHTYVENFASRLDWGYFAIFDGHAGNQASKWCGSHLHTIIEERILQGDDRDVRDILNDSFVYVDQQINSTLEGNSGCTAAVGILRWEAPTPIPNMPINLEQHKRMLYTANVGDTRIILFRNGRSVRLTYDHKASDIIEMQRVEKAGGLIMKSRVNGMLAVTRSLGDKFFDSLVVGNPFTTSVEITTSDQFLIIACDGLWDVVDDQEACEMIKDIEDANEAAKTLVRHALEHGTTDNVTVMVVFFDNNQ